MVFAVSGSLTSWCALYSPLRRWVCLCVLCLGGWIGKHFSHIRHGAKLKEWGIFLEEVFLLVIFKSGNYFFFWGAFESYFYFNLYFGIFDYFRGLTPAFFYNFLILDKIFGFSTNFLNFCNYFKERYNSASMMDLYSFFIGHFQENYI